MRMELARPLLHCHFIGSQITCTAEEKCDVSGIDMALFYDSWPAVQMQLPLDQVSNTGRTGRISYVSLAQPTGQSSPERERPSP